MKKLEKIWCTYGGILGQWDIGKITRESDEFYRVQYSEGQLYPPEAWDKEMVKPFKTLEGAIRSYSRISGEYIKKTRKRAKIKFPSAFKEK